MQITEIAIIELAVVAVMGLLLGSFGNALIYRLPRNIPFGTSRSACPQCGAMIRAFDNIPLISYLILRGRCRTCKTHIPWRYPVVEALHAGVFVWLYFSFGFTLQLAAMALLGAALIVIIFIDLEHMIIPDKLTLPGMILGLIYSLTSDGIGIASSAIGLLVGGGALYAIAILGDFLFKKESMGGGDIKMAAMLGAFLGWQRVLLIFISSAGIGLLVSIAVMAFSEKFRRERMLPFGPFLALAGFVAMVYGDKIIRLYVDNFLVQ